MALISRRNFFKTVTGALAFGSSYSLLKSTGIADTPPIRIANILDKTGVLNIYALKQIQACAMAADEINAAGGLLGRPVEIVFYDSQSNTQLNSQYATQAIVRDKVSVVQGGITSPQREVMRSVVGRFDNLLFYNCLYEGGVCDRRHVCTGMVPAQQLEVLVPTVTKEMGAKRAYIVAADYSYGHLTSRWLQKIIRDNGGEDVAVEFFPFDVTNFAPSIARIQNEKPDAVFSVLVGSAHISFYRQFHAAMGGSDIILAGTTYGLGRDQLELTAAEGEGILIATSFVDDLDTPAARSFVQRFHDFTGETDFIGEYGEYGHRGVMLWAEAVKKAGSAEPDAVKEQLGGVSFDGPGGLYTIDPQTHHVTMDVHICRQKSDRSFEILQSHPQRPPVDTQLVCDLVANPDDAQQYVIEVQ